MKNKLKDLNKISNYQMQVRLEFENEIQQIIKDKLKIDLVVCYHHHVLGFAIYNNDSSIYIYFNFIDDKIENKSHTGYIKISQKIIKLVNNLFK